MSSQKNSEVVFEGWLYKLAGSTKGSFSLHSNLWKPKFVVLRVYEGRPVLEYYNRQHNSTGRLKARAKLTLLPTFRIDKLTNHKNRAYVCEVLTAERRLLFSADEQRFLDDFIFYIQIQARLSIEVRDDYFIVQPENSEANRRIGTCGAQCMLHVSPWGVTLALQASRSVVAQWPLKSIRCYESTGRGQFCLEAGRVAPMGDGTYIFTTRDKDDDTIYDMIDRYIQDALHETKKTSQQMAREQLAEFELEYSRLRALTIVRPCTAHEAHLSRLSYTGNSSHSNAQSPTGSKSSKKSHDSSGRLPQGLPNSPSSGTSGRSQRIRPQEKPLAAVPTTLAFRRQESSNRPLPPTPDQSLLDIRVDLNAVPVAPRRTHLQNDRLSGYLDMSKSTEQLDKAVDRSVRSLVTPRDAWSPPPSFSAVFPEENHYDVARPFSDPSRQSPKSSVEEPVGGYLTMDDWTMRSRLRSYSCEDLTHYMRMSQSFRQKFQTSLAPTTVPTTMTSTATSATATAVTPTTPQKETPTAKPRIIRKVVQAGDDDVTFPDELEALVPSGPVYDNIDQAPVPFESLPKFEHSIYTQVPKHSSRNPLFEKRVNSNINSHVYESQRASTTQMRQYFQENSEMRRSISNPGFFNVNSKSEASKQAGFRLSPFKAINSSMAGKKNKSLTNLFQRPDKRSANRENNAKSNAADSVSIDGSLDPNRRPRSNSLIGRFRPRSNSSGMRVRSDSVTKSQPDLLRRGSRDSLSSFKGIKVTDKSRSFIKKKPVNNETQATSSRTSTVSEC